MSKMLRYGRVIIPAIVAICFAPAALAVTCTSTATGGNWNATATWTGCAGGNGTPANTPGAADTAIIATTGANVVTANVAITVGNVVINSGKLNVAGSNWTVNGTTTVNNSGTIDQTNTGGSATFIGLVTVNTGGTWNNSINEAVVFRGGITNDGTFTGGTATQTFNTNSQAISGTSPINFGGIVAVTGAITITNNTSVVTIAGNLTGSVAGSTWVNAANSTLNYGGAAAPMATGVLTATAPGNTVNYSRAGAQTAKVTTYSNLTLSGSGAKTFATTPTVNGVLSMEGTATVTVTTGVVTYGANATLQYNTATARTATAEEWMTPFAATGGVIIANTGAITMGAAKVFNTGIPLTINAGATLTPAASLLTLGGDFNNLGTFTSGSGGVTITGTVAQAIDGFTTTGTVSMTKTAGTATLQGNINGGAFILNGAGGTLDLGVGLTHTFTGAWTRTAGTLNGGSSTLNIGGSCSGAGGAFTASTGTVNWNAAGAQTVCPVAYNNLGLSNSGAKTMTGVTTIGGNLNISGTATMTGNAAFTVGGALNYSSSGTTTLTAATPISIGSFNQTAGTITAGANTVTVSGNWNETGNFTSTGTVTLNGVAAQTISGTSPVTFSTLNVTNAANPNITLAATNVTVTTLTGTARLTPSCPDYTLTSTTPAQVLHSCATVVNSINRADPDPTSAATVSWTVTFNQSVSGVDASAFSLVASGVSGAYITTVTGSGTTWTVTANTGIGSGTLRLDQTGPGSVVPPLSGTFTTGEFYTITATPALAEYRMDEAAWNGTANEVVDSSGSYPGTAANTAIPPPASTAFAGDPAYTSGAQSTCRYGLFDSTTSPVQSQTYVDLKSTFPKLNSNYTVTAWIRSNDITRTGQRIFVNDDANQGWSISLGDGGAGRLRVFNRSAANSGTPTAGGYNPGCGVFCLGTLPGVITNGAWYFVAVTVDTVDKQVTLYAWDSALTPLVATSTAYTGTWGTDPGATAIGGETSVSGEYGGTFAFVGNIDEVRVYQKVLSQSAIAAIAAQTHTCAAIVIVDHVAIDAPTVAATLTDVPITIEPHDAAHTSLSIESTINLSTSTGAGDWAIGTGTGTLTPGAANSGLATYTFGPGETSVMLDFNYQTAGLVTINVADGGGGDLLLNTPVGEKANVINFTASSFVFTDSACVHNIAFGAPGQTCVILNWSPQIAGQDVTNIYITAVDGAGVPSRLSRNRNRTRNMQFGLSCRDPVANAGIQATFDVVTLPLCEANGATPTVWSATVAAFFPAGIPSAGPYIFNYADVGQVNLWMQNSASPAQIGASGSFVVKPGGFVLSNIQQTAAPNLVNPAAANAAGTAFVKAGEMFSVTVTATTCTPASATCTVAAAATPNYGNETALESVLLASALVAPGGGSNPAIGGVFGTFTSGAATGTAFTWDEVGIINLTPSVGDGDYLGEGDVTGTPSGNVGRFFPDHFDTAVFATATLPMPCPTGLTCPTLYDGFVYSGQPFSVQVFARNLAGGTTANYDGTLGFSMSVTLTAWDTLGGATQNPGSGVLGSTAAVFTSGVATLTDTPTYTFVTSPTAPNDIYVRAVDTDSVTSLRAVPANSVEGGVKVASGRVKIGNAHGSELLPLPMTATVQYYSGTYWTTSATDDVTSFNTTLSTSGGNLVATIVSGLGGGITVSSPGSAAVIDGVRSFSFSAPGVPGSADIALNVPTYLPSNTARATFGVYKGNNEFIYLRETY